MHLQTESRLGNELHMEHSLFCITHIRPSARAVKILGAERRLNGSAVSTKTWPCHWTPKSPISSG